MKDKQYTYNLQEFKESKDKTKITHISIICNNFNDPKINLNCCFVLVYLKLEGCQIRNLCFIPNTVKYLCLYGNLLKDIPNVPLSLEYLNLGINKFEIFNYKLPDNLKYLNIEYNKLKIFNSELPNSLKYLFINGNSLKNFDVKLSDSLIHLTIDENELKKFNCILPLNLRWIDISHNKLKTFDCKIINSNLNGDNGSKDHLTVLEELYLDDTKLRIFEFSNVSDSLKNISLRQNIFLKDIKINKNNITYDVYPNIYGRKTFNRIVNANNKNLIFVNMDTNNNIKNTKKLQKRYFYDHYK